MDFVEIVGPHPTAPDPLGVHVYAIDEHTDHGVPHRLLNSISIESDEFIEVMREWLRKHHVSPENAVRDKKRREALARQGFDDNTKRFPENTNTQKGNWGEILLAEYIISSCNNKLPIYRLRYNPNIDQSMKGDDVLAFDVDSKQVRIVIGEAKYRATPSKKAVEDIVNALTKSHNGGLPISLGFVVDRLFGEESNPELGEKIDACNLLFSQGRLQIDHVGLFVSNNNATAHVNRNASTEIQRLAVISLGLNDPDDIVSQCFNGLEKKS